MQVLLFAAFWTAAGALGCSLLAARKGHDEGEWFVLGAALGPIGLVVLSRAPHLEPISYLVQNARLPKLVECAACRRVVPVNQRCSSCDEPIAGAPASKRRLRARRPRLPRRS